MQFVSHSIRLAALLALTVTTGAHATPIGLISTIDLTQINGTAYVRTSSADSPLYQQFSVTQKISVSSVTAMLGLVDSGVTLGGITLSILADSGSNTFGSVVADGVAQTPTGTLSMTGFNSAGINFAFASAPTLTPGTYWIEVQSPQGGSLRTRWAQQKSTTTVVNAITTAGSVSNLNYYLGDYHSAGRAFGLQVNGDLVSTVPEPQSLALVLSALALAGSTARRRRSQA